QREYVIAVEYLTGRPAEMGEVARMAAVKLVNAQAQLAGEACLFQAAQDLDQMLIIFEPDAVGNDLVEAKSQRCRALGECEDELRIEERFAAGEAEDLDAVGVGVLQEA